MELVGSTIASVMFRLLSPITLSLYESVEHVAIVALFGTLSLPFLKLFLFKL
jgi:hypothetical protein